MHYLLMNAIMQNLDFISMAVANNNFILCNTDVEIVNSGEILMRVCNPNLNTAPDSELCNVLRVEGALNSVGFVVGNKVPLGGGTYCLQVSGFIG